MFKEKTENEVHLKKKKINLSEFLLDSRGGWDDSGILGMSLLETTIQWTW